MILKFFQVYPLEKIQELFPKLKDPYRIGRYAETGIVSSWVPDMVNAAGKIYKIAGQRNDGMTFFLQGSDWNFDTRLGRVLLVDPELRGQCCYMAYRNFEYQIVPRYTPDAIGGIVNMPPPSVPNPQDNVLKKLLSRRRETHYGKMAISHGT